MSDELSKIYNDRLSGELKKDVCVDKEVNVDRSCYSQNEYPPIVHSVSFTSFALKSLFWSILAYSIGKQFAINDLWIVVGGVWIFSIPVMLSWVYASTIRQIQRLNLFTRRAWLFRLLSGRTIKTLVWLCVAVFTSFCTLLQFHTYSALEWAVFFLVIPLFWVVFALCRNFFSGELKPYIVTSLALTWSRRIATPLMLLVYAGLLLLFATPQEYSSISAAIEAQKSAISSMTGSAIIWEASQYLAVYDGLKAYALSRIGHEDALLAVAMTGFGGLAVFYNTCSILSCLLIPAVEYRRVFGSLTDADVPPSIPVTRLASVVALLTFVSLFLYLPAFTVLENWVRHSPELSQVREEAEAWTVLRLEKIDEAFFRPGTIDQLNQAKLEALRKVQISLLRLQAEADGAFDRMEGNVDSYLDWYYSLSAEYGRVAYLMAGEVEQYMAEKLESELLQGVNMQKIDSAIQDALRDHESAMKFFLEKKEAILAQNLVEPGAGRTVEIVKTVSLQGVISHNDFISFGSRMLGSGITGAGVAGVVGSKVVGKVVGKSTFKFAAKSMAKLAANKAAGAAGGATAGATAGSVIGSVVPGLGNAVGAVLGGIAGGLISGLAIDKALLWIEESLNREEFKQEILASINEQRREFQAALSGTQ